MALTVELRDAALRLSEFVSLAESGSEVVLTEGNIPRAKLTPIAPKRLEPRVAGLHEGQARVSDDFYDPLPESFWLGEELEFFSIRTLSIGGFLSGDASRKQRWRCA